MSRGAGNYERFTDEQKTIMRQMKADGCSNTDIAHELNMRPSRVADWFKAGHGGYAPLPANVDLRLKPNVVPGIPLSRLMAGR